MKTAPIFLLLLNLTGCHKSPVDHEEIKATITNLQIGNVAHLSGIYIETQTHQTYFARNGHLPISYSDYRTIKLPAPVWIRYKAPIEPCSQFPELIEIVSIRAR